MKKKILIMILLIALFMLLPLSVFSAEIVAGGIGSDDFTWKIDSEGVLTISGIGEMMDYDEIVYAIESNTDYDDRPWSEFCEEINKVIIKNGVTSIGNYSFYDCEYLEDIVLPESISEIGDLAFYFCDSLTRVVIPEGVTAIGESSFAFCESLTSIEIPKSIKTIGAGAFEGCDSLNTVCYAGTKAEWDNVSIGENNECLTSVKNISYASVEIIDSGTCGENLTWAFESNGVLTIKGTGEIEIDDDSQLRKAHRNEIRELIIEGGVTSIGDHSFEYCSSLTSVVIHEGVTAIGASAFHGCHELINIVIPESVAVIGEEAFCDCDGLTSIVLPNGLKSIGESAFEYCEKLKCIEIPKSVKTIGHSAFMHCDSLTDVYYAGTKDEFDCIENSVQLSNKKHVYYKNEEETGKENNISEQIICSGTCGDDLIWILDGKGTMTISGEGRMNNLPFDSSIIPQITAVIIEDGVTSVGNWAFTMGFNIESVTIPESVITIGTASFGYCPKLTEIVLPDSIMTIGSCAFGGCYHLANVTIPRSVTSIEDHAFEGCSSLSNVKYNGTEEMWEAIEIDENGNEYLISEVGFYTEHSTNLIICVVLFVLVLGSGCLIVFYRKKGAAMVRKRLQSDSEDVINDNENDFNKSNTVTGKKHAVIRIVFLLMLVLIVVCFASLAFGSVEQTLFTAKEHSWNDGVITIEPTEDSTGVKTYTCLLCKDTRTEKIPILNHEHEYISVVTESSCTEKGYTTYTCSCGDVYTDNEVPAKGHINTLINVKKATENEEGYSGDCICSVCEKILKNGRVTSIIAIEGNVVTDNFYSVKIGSKNCHYHIPRVILSDVNVDLLNKKIKDDLYGSYEYALKSASANYYDPLGGQDKLSYICGQKDDVVSILAMVPFGVNNIYDYYIYNFSADTGEFVDKNALLSVYGLTTEEYNVLVKNAIEKFIRKEYARMYGSEEGKEVSSSLLTSNTDEKDIAYAMPYVGENGDLCIVARVWYLYAGSEAYDVVINVTGSSDAVEPAFETSEKADFIIKTR